MNLLQTEIHRLVGEILQGSVSTSKTGAYNPALVVGIGGTGMKAVRCLKKYLRQHGTQEVQIIGIDSDATENDKDYGQFPKLSPDELVVLDQNEAVKALERASRKNKNDAHILNFLPVAHDNDTTIHQDIRARIAGQKGAGQLRRAGKLLFVANIDSGANLGEKFKKINDTASGLSQTLERVGKGYKVENGMRIFVVCSIAGGQGAGALLDCLALLRKNFARPEDQITAVCLLPGKLIDRELHDGNKEKGQTRSNALGTLRELQALQLGKVSNPEFVFGSNNKFKLGTKLLANQVFLLDHSTYDHKSASSQLDMARAMGFFLYAFLGSGIGAHKEVGAINSGRGDTSDDGGKEIPEIFGSFGVAALEYPTEAITEYGLRTSLNTWLESVRNSDIDKKNIEASVDQLLASLKLRSPEELSAHICPEMPEAKFFATRAQEEQLVTKWDDEFFAIVGQARGNLGDDLSRYDEEIVERVGKVSASLKASITEKLMGQLKSGLLAAQYFADTLEKRLAEIANASADHSRNRPNHLRKCDDELKATAVWIKRIPMVDKSFKRTYVTKFRDYIQEKVAEKLDSHTARIIGAAQATILHLKVDLIVFKGTVDNLIEENQQAVKRLITDKEESSCFLQSRVTPSALPDWMASRLVKVPANVVLDSLQESVLISAPLNAIAGAYKNILSKLDLIQDLRDKGGVELAVSALEAASKPLMAMVESAPRLEDMRPMTFVAGAISPGDQVIDYFSKIGQTNVKAVGTGDSHRLICLQAIQGFGAAHWFHFEEAEKHYRDKEWRSHTMPDAEKFPTLKSLTEDRTQSLRDLGLAMAFGLVDLRSPNYYRNLSFNQFEQCHYFTGYAGAPNAGAQALLEAGLVKMPPQSAVKRSRTGPDFLAGSFEETVEEMQSARQADFCGLMRDVLGNLSANSGTSHVVKIVDMFVVGELDAMIARAKTNPARQDILRNMQQALSGYSAQLK